MKILRSAREGAVVDQTMPMCAVYLQVLKKRPGASQPREARELYLHNMYPTHRRAPPTAAPCQSQSQCAMLGNEFPIFVYFSFVFNCCARGLLLVGVGLSPSESCRVFDVIFS